MIFIYSLQHWWVVVLQGLAAQQPVVTLSTRPVPQHVKLGSFGCATPLQHISVELVPKSLRNKYNDIIHFKSFNFTDFTNFLDIIFTTNGSMLRLLAFSTTILTYWDSCLESFATLQAVDIVYILPTTFPWIRRNLMQRDITAYIRTCIEHCIATQVLPQTYDPV